MDNPYDVLRVPMTAPDVEVKAAYRRLVRVLHPDVNPDGEALFTKVTEAYRLLADPAARAAFDENSGTALWQHLFSDAPPESAADMSRASEYRIGVIRDGIVTVPLAFLEAALGTDVSVADPRTGDMFRVIVPAGTLDGAELPSPVGSTPAAASVAEHPVFRLGAGGELYARIPVTAVELTDGAAVSVPTVSGAAVKVQIPAGTAAGDSVPIRGRGLIVDGTHAADLIVTFAVVGASSASDFDDVKVRDLTARHGSAGASALEARSAVIRAVRNEQKAFTRR